MHVVCELGVRCALLLHLHIRPARPDGGGHGQTNSDGRRQRHRHRRHKKSQETPFEGTFDGALHNLARWCTSWWFARPMRGPHNAAADGADGECHLPHGSPNLEHSGTVHDKNENRIVARCRDDGYHLQLALIVVVRPARPYGGAHGHTNSDCRRQSHHQRAQDKSREKPLTGNTDGSGHNLAP